MSWWSSDPWWWFEVWRFAGAWSRVYTRGPVQLSESSATAEYLDTRESFFNEVVRLWKWDGARWGLVYS